MLRHMIAIEIEGIIMCFLILVSVEIMYNISWPWKFFMIQMQKDLYLCFTDYAKEFDKVHKKMLELLGNLKIFRKYIRIIQSLY